MHVNINERGEGRMAELVDALDSKYASESLLPSNH